MSIITLNDVKNEAMLLSIKDRALLIRDLLESLEREEENIEEAWIVEAEKRYAGYQQGTAKTHSAVEVFARIKSHLK